MKLEIPEGTIAPGGHVTYTLETDRRPPPLEISLVDREDLKAEVCTDQEGWIVVVLTNVVEVPVVITPLEPVRLVISRQREKEGGMTGIPMPGSFEWKEKWGQV